MIRRLLSESTHNDDKFNRTNAKNKTKNNDMNEM